MRTMKRKNVKGLALNKPAPRPPPPADDAFVHEDDQRGKGGQLEIGIEYKLDLKREDLEVLKELGSGNGGTVSKVRHIATGTVMARKVAHTYLSFQPHVLTNIRSYMSRLRRRRDAGLSVSCTSCTSVTRTIL